MNRLAVILTRIVGSMWCAFAFAVLAIIALPAATGSVLTLIQWVSQTFIQLVMLSVIMVGQNLAAAEHEAREARQFTDIEAIYLLLKDATPTP